ncbi:radical SAM protein, partial [Selenomonas noxia]
ESVFFRCKKGWRKAMKYKGSMYNLYYQKDDEHWLIFNTLSGGLCLVDPETYVSILNGYPESGKWFQDLFEQGYIVACKKDECGTLRYKRILYMFKDSSTVSFVIAPCMTCNLRCIYCFERQYIPKLSAQKAAMDDETANRCTQFIEGYCSRIKPERLHIQWFGGEPLLCYDRIIDMSSKLIKFCENQSIEYSSFMITNGLLLNNKKIDTLSERCKVTHFQFTLDGDASHFAKYKQAPIIEYTNLINNIKYATGRTLVSVRMNVSRENEDAILRTAIALAKSCDNPDHLKIYASKIYGKDNEGCHCLTDGEFEEFRVKFDAILKEMNAGNGSIPIRSARRLTYCPSMTKDHFVIDPNGDIYKCECEIGNENEVIGNLKCGLYHNQAESKYFFETVPEKCQRCSYYPLCHHGCITARLNHGRIVDCDAFRRRIDNKIKDEILGSSGLSVGAFPNE